MSKTRLCTFLVAAGLLLGMPARAQTPVSSIALNQLDPSAPGDAFFSVPSPGVGGHLVPRGLVMFDYASQPLALAIGPARSSIVSYEAVLHAGVSLSLFDRLLVSVSLPTTVAQAGDSPVLDGAPLPAPPSAAVGDLRAGLRVRLFGAEQDILGASVGANVYLPTASAGSFAGEGAVRLSPQLLVGGRAGRVVWSASLGGMFHGSKQPAAVTYGAGVGVLLFDGRLQIGPEVHASSPLQDSFLDLTEATTVARGTTTGAELLLGVKARLISGLMVGAAGGPGLSDAVGTPPFRVLGMIAWSPASAKIEGAAPKTLDADDDGILDAEDACPFAFGPKSAEPKQSGCPVKDRDEDGVPDGEDGCPDVAGDAAPGAKKRGCPPDRDGDTVPDLLDACPDEKGDAAANGCAKR